ncbi:hypothetical protein D9756_007158 [Leucocoprinus leucothites]|uniref:Uncharacterized protein n=1 Tax=Leucocoprinus leucothites TaxID=201217 RepID=A0A8H5D6A1_9AGAR|nr:hypothetical protein D9756_007158 [Leucoagaricus leucothites]
MSSTGNEPHDNSPSRLAFNNPPVVFISAYMFEVFLYGVSSASSEFLAREAYIYHDRYQLFGLLRSCIRAGEQMQRLCKMATSLLSCINVYPINSQHRHELMDTVWIRDPWPTVVR